MRITRLYLRNYRVYEDELDLELPPGLVGIYGPNGSGKCLPGWTRVWDGETGEGVTIERFVRERRKWVLGYSDGKVKALEVSDWHKISPKPTVVVRLASGAELETAATHPILTDVGCVRASELTSDHWVGEARQLPALAPPLVTNDEAFLLGLLLGDGCVTDRAALSASDPDIVAAFRDATERTFPGCTVRSMAKIGTDAASHIVVSSLSPSERVERRKQLARRLRALGVPIGHYVGVANVPRFLRGQGGPSWESLLAIEEDFGLDLSEERCALHGGRAFIEWIRSFGLLGHDARSKRVPPTLLLLPDEPASYLLAGLWLTDGYIASPDGKTRTSRASLEVSYTTASPELADDVRALLLRMGMTSTRRVKRIGEGEFHDVVVTAESHARLSELPLVGKKRARALEAAKRRADVVGRPLHDLIPPSFGRGLSRRSASGKERSNKQLTFHAMSRRTYLDFGGSKEVAEAEIAWSRVVSVTPTGRSIPCFDLTVESPEHLYVADTFLVHNSLLVESILWSLYGYSRTAKEQVRTADVGGDCVTEVEFEHEGHLYLVRRTLSGINSTVKAQAEADGAQVAEGIQSVRQYVHSVLGMDAHAFRASVFAEQKQLAAFSQQRPGERRDLVLRLLGITPLDKARDEARRDARAAADSFQQARRVLPDLDALQAAADDAEVAAGARAADAKAEEEVAATAKARLVTADERFEALDRLRQEYDTLVAEGKAVRAAHDGAVAEVEALTTELAELDVLVEGLATHRAAAGGLEATEKRLRLVEEMATAERALSAMAVVQEPAPVDEPGCHAAGRAADADANRLAEVKGRLRSATEAEERAKAGMKASAQLSGEGACPICGQALGEAFEKVQAHRAAELRQAAEAVRALGAEQAELAKAARASAALAREAEAAVERSRVEWAAYERQRARRQDAEEALARTVELLGGPVSPDEAEALVADVAHRREASRQCQRIEGRLERRPAAEKALEAARSRLTHAAGRLDVLRDKRRSLGFRSEDTDAARRRRDEARAVAERAEASLHQAHVTAAQAGERATAAADALDRGRAQHAALEASAEEARHLGRVAELMGAFRNTVVATVGPRLSGQAAELFAELTDHEYDRLEVDAETYEIQIRDRGRLYDMERFSGSETDLANLALRVAISEHVRLLSGGAVGLLVLDEVFGPLDEDRKARMLGALERLKSRFRQVLVVTHDDTIKAALPHAIEVVKLPGRRATARLVN